MELQKKLQNLYVEKANRNSATSNKTRAQRLENSRYTIIALEFVSRIVCHQTSRSDQKLTNRPVFKKKSHEKNPSERVVDWPEDHVSGSLRDKMEIFHGKFRRNCIWTKKRYSVCRRRRARARTFEMKKVFPKFFNTFEFAQKRVRRKKKSMGMKKRVCFVIYYFFCQLIEAIVLRFVFFFYFVFCFLFLSNAIWHFFV